jgi:GntR family transcriptional regulator, colanic acid and biofilm gene transcriptional regulator
MADPAVLDFGIVMIETLAIEKENLRARAYAVIRKALMAGRFQPGQKLLLRPMATDLGISVTPVREALLQLVSERALVTDSSRSLFVPVLDVERFREIRDLRIELEGRAAEAAAARALPLDVAELEALQNTLVTHRHAGNFREVLVTNEAFHFKLYGIAQMPVLYDIIERLWVQIGPIFTRLFERIDPMDTANHPHNGIIAALDRKDSAAARIAIAKDISWSSQCLEESLQHMQTKLGADPHPLALTPPVLIQPASRT